MEITVTEEKKNNKKEKSVQHTQGTFFFVHILAKA